MKIEKITFGREKFWRVEAWTIIGKRKNLLQLNCNNLSFSLPIKYAAKAFNQTIFRMWFSKLQL